FLSSTDRIGFDRIALLLCVLGALATEEGVHVRGDQPQEGQQRIKPRRDAHDYLPILRLAFRRPYTASSEPTPTATAYTASLMAACSVPGMSMPKAPAMPATNAMMPPQTVLLCHQLLFSSMSLPSGQ